MTQASSLHQKYSFQVLCLADAADVFAFAMANLQQQVPDESERMFRAWEANWRQEALEYYARLGWSFVARDLNRDKQAEPNLVGFILAQPLLFFRGQTQTLWVEHIEVNAADERDGAVRTALIDIAIRTAREKHLQRVLLADGAQVQKCESSWNFSRLNETIYEVKTTKG